MGGAPISENINGVDVRAFSLTAPVTPGTASKSSIARSGGYDRGVESPVTSLLRSDTPEGVNLILRRIQVVPN